MRRRAVDLIYRGLRGWGGRLCIRVTNWTVARERNRRKDLRQLFDDKLSLIKLWGRFSKSPFQLQSFKCEKDSATGNNKKWTENDLSTSLQLLSSSYRRFESGLQSVIPMPTCSKRKNYLFMKLLPQISSNFWRFWSLNFTPGPRVNLCKSVQQPIALASADSCVQRRNRFTFLSTLARNRVWKLKLYALCYQTFLIVTI